MSAPLLSRIICGISGKCTNLPCMVLGCNGSVRQASKKAGSSTRNKKGPTKGKHRGPKVFEREEVHAGEIVFRQLGLKVYPGENVGIGRDQTLFALKDGNVVVSCEAVSPYPHSPLYTAVKAGRVLYRTFYHVIAKPRPGKFRLVSQT